MFAAQEQADIGDDQIGHLLAGSPPGEDGAWPAEPVRDLVESLESEAFEVGLKVGRANMRGVTSRGVYEGGNQERALAEDYRESAEAVGARWPATGRLLRTMAEDYEAEARMHDTEAEGRADSE